MCGDVCVALDERWSDSPMTAGPGDVVVAPRGGEGGHTRRVAAAALSRGLSVWCEDLRRLRERRDGRGVNDTLPWKKLVLGRMAWSRRSPSPSPSPSRP